MTFDAREESVELGTPAALVRFKYGTAANAVFRYTDHDSEIVFDAGAGDGPETYVPLPIMAGDITTAGHLDDAILYIEVPYDSGIAQLYHDYPPNHPVTLTIRQGHIGDGEWPVKWIGRVVSCVAEDYTARIACEPASTGMSRLGLRRHYQYGCPHVLYSTGDNECKANKAAATSSVTVESVSGAEVRFAAGWSGVHATTKYIGGYLQWTDANGNRQIRSILRITADDLGVLVAGDTSTIVIGAAVDIVLGCNHQESDCINLHNNIVNYGGQPWLPTENPMTFVNLWY